MKKIYPYYEIKDKVDSFVILYGEQMTKDKWTIESRPCKKTDELYDKSIRETDERFFHITNTDKKKVNYDYLFVKRDSKGRSKKAIYSHMNNFGFLIDDSGLIIDIKNVTGNTNP